MLRERKNDIASFVEHPAYSNFKMYTALILFFYFNFPLFTQNSSLKVIYSWNFTWSVKGAVILLRSWSTLHTEFLKCKMSWFYFFYFDLQLLKESVHVKVTFFEILGAPRRKQLYCFVRRVPRITFLKRKMIWFYFFVLICHC